MKNAGRYYRLLVVVQAMALMFLFVATSGRRRPDIRPVLTDNDVRVGLPAALEKFKSDCGRYPTKDEGFKALVSPPDTISLAIWKGPYLEQPMQPIDRWGHPYVYNCPSVHGSGGYDIYSLGPDGANNTADDIGNWGKPQTREGDFLFKNAQELLLIIPFLFMIRVVAGIISPRVRAVVSKNRLADRVWAAMAVFATLLSVTAPTIDGKIVWFWFL